MSVLRPALRFGPVWVALGLLIALAIAAGSLVPSRNLPNIGLSDKIEHALSYALLAFWFGSIFGRRALPATLVALLAFGALMELLQGWMGMGRAADVKDMLANSLGILAGLLLCLTPLGNWPQRVESLFAPRPAP
jgi:VanZ family protein